MPWPFSSAGPPNLDTGPGVVVPTSPGVVTTSAAWLLGAHFTNLDGSNTRLITVTDTAGAIVAELAMSPGAEQAYEWPFRPVNGVKWVADGANVGGHLWGYI